MRKYTGHLVTSIMAGVIGLSASVLGQGMGYAGADSLVGKLMQLGPTAAVVIVVIAFLLAMIRVTSDERRWRSERLQDERAYREDHDTKDRLYREQREKLLEQIIDNNTRALENNTEVTQDVVRTMGRLEGLLNSNHGGA